MNFGKTERMAVWILDKLTAGHTVRFVCMGNTGREQMRRAIITEAARRGMTKELGQRFAAQYCDEPLAAKLSGANKPEDRP